MEQQVSFHNIQQLAGGLNIIVANGDTWFDLDTAPDEHRTLHGTYRKTTAGIETAYGDLVRFRDSSHSAHTRSTTNER